MEALHAGRVAPCRCGPEELLAYGDPRSPGTLGYIAKKGRLKADARECVTEEIISKIGAMLPDGDGPFKVSPYLQA